MTWAGTRKAELPPDWQQRRQVVLARDGGRCVGLDGNYCGWHATDVDHIDDRDDHSIENLRSLCGHHHRKRTAQQALEARRRKAARLQRPSTPHPGRKAPPAVA
jgi:5-methylcytosine-specific restriction protein A